MGTEVKNNTKHLKQDMTDFIPWSSLQKHTVSVASTKRHIISSQFSE